MLLPPSPLYLSGICVGQTCDIPWKDESVGSFQHVAPESSSKLMPRLYQCQFPSANKLAFTVSSHSQPLALSEPPTRRWCCASWNMCFILSLPIAVKCAQAFLYDGPWIDSLCFSVIEYSCLAPLLDSNAIWLWGCKEYHMLLGWS